MVTDYSAGARDRVHNEKNLQSDYDPHSRWLTGQSLTSTAGTKKRAVPKETKSDSALNAHVSKKPAPAKAKNSRKRKPSSSDSSDSEFEKAISKGATSKVFITAYSSALGVCPT